MRLNLLYVFCPQNFGSYEYRYTYQTYIVGPGITRLCVVETIDGLLFVVVAFITIVFVVVTFVVVAFTVVTFVVVVFVVVFVVVAFRPLGNRSCA